MSDVPSYWLGPGHAPGFSRSVARASQTVRDAEAALHEALKQGYPHGSEVYVIHHRGSFSGFVVGWDTHGTRVAVKNARTLKTSKWWAAHVQRVEHTADGTDGVDVPAPAQPSLTPREVEVLREIRLHAKFDGLNEGWQMTARNLLLGLERFYSGTAATPERLELTDAEAGALQRAEVVRDALLAYHYRPCDKEAAAVMKAVASQFTTRVAPPGVAVPQTPEKS